VAVKTTIKAAFFLAALMVPACSAHSPFIMKNTTDSKPAGSAKTYVAHTKPIWLTAGGLPARVKYEVLETIQAGRIWYGDSEKVQKQMANRARAIGADAIIYVTTWHQPSGFAWAAPHGTGQAVKLEDPGAIDFNALPGAWF
jgi:hypothetical protein